MATSAPTDAPTESINALTGTHTESTKDTLAGTTTDDTTLMKPGTTLLDLPAEIRLAILVEFFDFPNGLHSDRWTNIRMIRVANVLQIPGLAHMVPEALFKHIALVVKPNYYLSDTNLALTYPSPLVAHRVEHMVLQFGYFRLGNRFDTDLANLHKELYLRWLQKLADGQLGFNSLQTFKISFLDPAYAEVAYSSLVQQGISYKFPCKDVQVEYGWPTRPGNKTERLLRAHLMGTD